MIPVVYINTKRNPFVTQIMLMLKQYETRTRNTLKSLMEWSLGERILIAETGHGDPVVRCSAVIDHIIAVHTEDEWNKYRSATCVPVGSEYDWKSDTKVKWLYHLSDIRPVCSFVLPKSCRRHGRVWAEYEGCYLEWDKIVYHDELES